MDTLGSRVLPFRAPGRGQTRMTTPTALASLRPPAPPTACWTPSAARADGGFCARIAGLPLGRVLGDPDLEVLPHPALPAPQPALPRDFRSSKRFSEVSAATARVATSPLVGVFQAGYAEIDGQIRAAGDDGQAQPGRYRSLLDGVERSLRRAIASETRCSCAAPRSWPPPRRRRLHRLFGTVWGSCAPSRTSAGRARPPWWRSPRHRRGARQHRAGWPRRSGAGRIQLPRRAVQAAAGADGGLRARVHEPRGAQLHLSGCRFSPERTDRRGRGPPDINITPWWT